MLKVKKKHKMTLKEEVKSMETIDVPPEDILTKLMGQFGKWQLIMFTSVALIKVSAAWIQMAILFLTPFSTFRCVQFTNSTCNETISGVRQVSVSTCYEDCVRYEHETRPFANTIVSEWDLVCERRWLASFTQTLLQLGVLVGSTVFGFLSDRYGRRKTFLLSVSMMVVCSFALPFSPNYWLFTALRFILGMGCAGTMVVSFVLLVEITSPRYREILGCIYHLPFVVGHMSLPLFAYLFTSWNSYSLALAVPQLVYLMYFMFLPESPRWLASVGRVDDATSIVKRVAEMNKLPTDNIEESILKFSSELSSRSQVSSVNYGHLFRSRLVIRTMAVCFIWLSSGLMFFGFNQYLSQTSSNPFISTLLAGVIQIPTVLMSICLIKRFGRRIVTAVSFCLGGVFVISLNLIPQVFWLTTTISTIGVSFASITATVLYLYTSELYPTVIRNMAVGAASTSMRVGSMLAPFVSNVPVTWVPPLVIGVTQICAGLVCFLLPETKGTLLPDNMDDLKRENKTHGATYD